MAVKTINRSELIKSIADGYTDNADLDALIECYHEQTIEWLSEFTDSELEAEYNILGLGNN